MIMVTQQNPPKTFAIATHPAQPKAAVEAKTIADALTQLGLKSVMVASIYDPQLKHTLVEGAADFLIALGGDGTMLRAGHLVAPLGVPVLGINRGRFGFLMEIGQSGFEEQFQQLARGEYWLESRMMLRCVHRRLEDFLAEWHVLNDVVISRGQYVRPIELTASLDGYVLATYNADALIVSTATGSTAYALAAGGPILPPELRNILIVPVAPHLSVDRSIILSEGAKVVVKVNTSHQAVLSADGQPPVILKDDDIVEASAGEYSVSFIRFEDPGYFYRNLSQYMERSPITGG
jgi:NAD+ kinase